MMGEGRKGERRTSGEGVLISFNIASGLCGLGRSKMTKRMSSFGKLQYDAHCAALTIKPAVGIVLTPPPDNRQGTHTRIQADS